MLTVILSSCHALLAKGRVILRFRAPDPRQRPFGPGHPPGIRPVIRNGQQREPVTFVPGSCCLSAAGIRLSGHPVPARELGLPHSRLTGPAPGPGRGFHVPHLRDVAGVGASSTPGTAVLSLARCRARPAPAASQRPVPAPRTHIPPRGCASRGINGGSHDSPVRPAPSLWPPGGTGDPWAFPCAPHPAVTSGARQGGAGPGVSTRPELRNRHNRPSNPRVPSQGATSCRNGMCACSRVRLPAWPRAGHPEAGSCGIEVGGRVDKFGVVSVG
jgi:hypothetical protein